MISTLDLKPQDAAMQDAVERAMLRVARSGRYVLGAEVEAFEEAWARRCGTRYCIGTGNCLDSLRMVLTAWEIGPGDEVIVPANTYIATWLAVSLVGARPVPVEPDQRTYTIDQAKIEAAVTPRTRAIIPVHLYGHPADLEAVHVVAERHGLSVLEDAAQAHGLQGYGIGGLFGGAAAWSFYPSKNLGALGDAGAVTTDDPHLANAVRRLRNYGGVGRLDHTVRGINSRMDEMQAAVLLAKLPFLDSMNAARAQRAAHYRAALADTSLVLPPEGGVYHQFVVRSNRRRALLADLAERGIDCHVHYPVPPYLEPAYADMGMRKGAFPITEALADEVVSLPIGYEFDIERVCDEIATTAGVLDCAHG